MWHVGPSAAARRASRVISVAPIASASATYRASQLRTELRNSQARRKEHLVPVAIGRPVSEIVDGLPCGGSV